MRCAMLCAEDRDCLGFGKVQRCVLYYKADVDAMGAAVSWCEKREEVGAFLYTVNRSHCARKAVNCCRSFWLSKHAN